ncbi:LolA family protein [Geobacter grbiciae]|uniref:LolA family protein n=1 Tax=Geobacter grbiciae TaxID=155042 RepID=UPI001C017A06|nr:outer membrane lipoprotein carrier protein LolA [Geobacter grbiciae]MBT1074327.1 outer membrane lipoprotein carrier protein LolA [Geobacter grbiciae]
MRKVISTVMTLTLLLVLAWGGSAAARQIAPVEGLETLRRSFAGISDFSADIVQEKQISLLKRKMVSTGTVRFRKPSLFFMELNPPRASRLLLNDTQITLYFPREKSTSQMALPPEQSLQHWFTFLARPVTSLPDGVDVRADQQGDTLTITVIPRSGGQVREFAVTLLTDGTIRKLVISEKNGDQTRITFSRVRKNSGLSDKDFRIN